MELSYKKLKAQRIGDAEVEHWHAFRELGKIVYRREGTQVEFPAEWLGWDRWWGHWLWVLLPPKLDKEGHLEHEVEALASQIHLALSLMKIRNVVTVEMPSAPATPQEREATLKDFTEWMNNHGWRIRVTRLSTLGRKLRIKRRGLRFFRPEPTPEQILAQGRWTARAFEALSECDGKDVALYVGEGARHGNFLVSIDW